jgi:hypothetical protein
MISGGENLFKMEFSKILTPKIIRRMEPINIVIVFVPFVIEVVVEIARNGQGFLFRDSLARTEDA